MRIYYIIYRRFFFFALISRSEMRRIIKTPPYDSTQTKNARALSAGGGLIVMTPINYGINI